MAELKPTTIASTTTNTAAQPHSMAATPNGAARLTKRLQLQYDRLYLLSTLGHLAIESLEYNTDTDTARAALTGMLEMLASDFEGFQSLMDLVGADTTQVTTAPAGMEA
jgi:hypothetical protein